MRQYNRPLRQEIQAEGLTPTISHYTDAVRFGDDVAPQTRQEFFGGARPDSTLIGSAAPAIPGMKIEIEAIAGMPS